MGFKQRVGIAMTPDERRAQVREGYEASSPSEQALEIAARIGYTDEEIASLPVDANLGFGCGNPTAYADLRPGEHVLDLGSGAGVDVFLSARLVGSDGRAFGVDMTKRMLERARAAGTRFDLDNVEFREGTIETLPFDDACVDVVISNGVINLSPDRERVFVEALRVLRPSGRLVVADLGYQGEIDPRIISVSRRFLGTLLEPGDYPNAIRAAGFTDVTIEADLAYGNEVLQHVPSFTDAAREAGVDTELLNAFFERLIAVTVRASKP